MVERFKPRNEYGQDTKLKAIIDKQTILHNEEKRAGKIRQNLYASDYDSCMRKVFMDHFPETYPKGEVDPRQLRVMQNGDKVHERLGAYLRREQDIDFHDEIDVPRDELEVHGRCDGRCTVDSQAVIVEFKSINKEVVCEPKSGHIGQISWYMEMFRQLRKDVKARLGLAEDALLTEHEVAELAELNDLTPVEKWLLESQGEIAGEIIYESKQNNQVYHFPIDYDAGRVEKVRLWFQQMKTFIDRKELPPLRNSRYEFPCQWGRPGTQAFGRCPYYGVCWGNDSEEK